MGVGGQTSCPTIKIVPDESMKSIEHVFIDDTEVATSDIYECLEIYGQDVITVAMGNGNISMMTLYKTDVSPSEDSEYNIYEFDAYTHRHNSINEVFLMRTSARIDDVGIEFSSTPFATSNRYRIVNGSLDNYAVAVYGLQNYNASFQMTGAGGRVYDFSMLDGTGYAHFTYHGVVAVEGNHMVYRVQRAILNMNTGAVTIEDAHDIAL